VQVTWAGGVRSIAVSEVARVRREFPGFRQG